MVRRRLVGLFDNILIHTALRRTKVHQIGKVIRSVGVFIPRCSFIKNMNMKKNKRKYIVHRSLFVEWL
jgi:hypothetical protein